MKYRELQAELKAKGWNAKGSKKQLEARLAQGYGRTDAAPEAKPSGLRKFVFTGDEFGRCDPAWCDMHGYNFKLNGAAVSVTDDIAAKLATHSHFTEA